MWQGSKNLRATQKKSRTRNKQMAAAGYISDMDETLKVSCSHFQLDGAAEFKLLERLPLPPALSAKDPSEGQTQILNVCWIRTINCHPVESDEDCAPESIADTENCQTGIATLIIQLTAKSILRQTMNLIQSKTMVSRIRNAKSSRIWMPRQMFPYWFSEHGSQRDRLERCWWRSM